MMAKPKLGRVEEVNKELWLLLSVFAICLLLNLVVDAQRMVLSFYTLPTLGSAYLYGRRHATLTALASVLLVVLMTWYNPVLFAASASVAVSAGHWLDIVVWGGVLVITGYSMGTLYEHRSEQLAELRETYHGVLMILRHFIAKDPYTENHSYRVSVYAATIAMALDLPTERVEDVRAAALLHDIGKLDVSRDLLYKAARLTKEEFEQMQQHVSKGVAMLEPVGGSLRRVIPIVLAHHDKFDGSGYHPNRGNEIPLEARIISVADVYDSLTSDRPYRKAMSTFEAKEIIVKGAGTDFDPEVVTAFVEAFRKGGLEVPAVVV
ncbi:MAG TPA: HD-GYP domain-containing protein [Vicinamibacterales bacterium]|nr:HD-GYP domain-containing protein [Vicinamibacterales bacterium]